jgi:hypothetical protein
MIIVTGQPQHARASRGRIIKMEFSNLNASRIVGTKMSAYIGRAHSADLAAFDFSIDFPELDLFMKKPVRRFYHSGRAGGQ